jgi:hypothetical protein
MQLSNITSEPDGIDINAKTILKRVQGLATYVRASSQRRKKFEKVVSFAQPELHKKGIKCLTADVATRWNSTFHMFQRAIQLQPSCTHFCQETDTRRYLLNQTEWDQAKNVMTLLEPLSKATEMLCASKYPTLNKALPAYMILANHLHTFRKGLYNQAQLIIPAEKMYNKINQYMCDALKKPVYICAMILDPTFKLTFWLDLGSFMHDQYNLTVDDVQTTFEAEAIQFHKGIAAQNTNSSQQDTAANHPTSSSSSKQQLFFSSVRQPAPTLRGVQAKISEYLSEQIEPDGAQALTYWATRQYKFPILAQMARRYLAIPATSAASERVFSKGRRVLSWQRASLKPKSIKQLICIKEWYACFNGPL